MMKFFFDYNLWWPAFGILGFIVCYSILIAAKLHKFRGVTPAGILLAIGAMTIGPVMLLPLLASLIHSLIDGNWSDWWTTPVCKCIPKKGKS